MRSPETCPLENLDARLRDAGFAVLAPAQTAELSGAPLEELNALAPFWNRLPADAFLRDGGNYRRRRHASFIVDGAQVTLAPHRPHWQPVEYNALHGGMERLFEPLEPEMLACAAWPKLIAALAGRASRLRGPQRWFVEAHPFRIDTTGGIGRPTPEGAHRDGVDLVAIFLVARAGVKGGETRVFEANGPSGVRFTLSEPWTALLLDDARVVHETTPIQPASEAGHRDTLVLTFRAGGFQGPR